jgi:hypothetical protein
VEEAEDALDHTNKMISTNQSIETVQQAVFQLNQKLLLAEERITEARLRKDTGTKLWREGQVTISAVASDSSHSLVAVVRRTWTRCSSNCSPSLR